MDIISNKRKNLLKIFLISALLISNIGVIINEHICNCQEENSTKTESTCCTNHSDCEDCCNSVSNSSVHEKCFSKCSTLTTLKKIDLDQEFQKQFKLKLFSLCKFINPIIESKILAPTLKVKSVLYEHPLKTNGRMLIISFNRFKTPVEKTA